MIKELDQAFQVSRATGFDLTNGEIFPGGKFNNNGSNVLNAIRTT